MLCRRAIGHHQYYRCNACLPLTLSSHHPNQTVFVGEREDCSIEEVPPWDSYTQDRICLCSRCRTQLLKAVPYRVRMTAAEAATILDELQAAIPSLRCISILTCNASWQADDKIMHVDGRVHLI